MNSNSLKISNENLKRRLNAERRFKFYGVIAISLALIFVLILFTNIISKGYSAFYRTLIEIKIEFNDKVQPEMLKQMSDTEINKLDLYSFSKKNIYSNFPDIEKKSDKKKIIKLFSIEFEEEIKTYINKNKKTPPPPPRRVASQSMWRAPPILFPLIFAGRGGSGGAAAASRAPAEGRQCQGTTPRPPDSPPTATRVTSTSTLRSEGSIVNALRRST